MACYYLVISSTHLSNGHFRSIKGVFRGPLRTNNGGESPDYAIKEEAIAKALEDLKANFYCELCDKQYHKHKEFDNHINSYDHAHKQRLKELKHREFARNVSSKNWKDERKQERAVRRLHQLALLKQQGDRDKGKSSKFRIATRDQLQEKIVLNSSERPVPKHILSQGQSGKPFSLDKISKRSSSPPVSTDQCSFLLQHAPPAPQTPKGHRHPRQGVSFCFSRRTQLKLESCASVFNDGVDEDHQELQCHRQRQALSHLWSRSPSPNLYQDSNRLPTDLASIDAPPETKQSDQEETWADCSTTEPNRKDSDSDMHDLEAEAQPAGSETRSAKQGQRLRPEQAYSEKPALALLQKSCLRSPSPSAFTDEGESSMAYGQMHTQADFHQDLKKGSEQITFNTELSPLETENTEDDLGTANHLGFRNSDLNDETLSYLNVLSKDGNTIKWPGELVHYTSDKPCVSYSCNPLSLKFRCAKGKEKSIQPEERENCFISRLADRPDTIENQIQDIHKDKLGILKPKKPKHKRRERVRRRKLDTVRKHQVGRMLGVCSQAPARGCFEFRGTPASALHRVKRHNLRKKRILAKDDVSNESDTPELKLKSIVVNSFSTLTCQRRKRQKVPPAIHRTKRRTIPCISVHCIAGSEDSYRWCGNLCESKWDSGATPRSDKSGSWGVMSDLSSDGEWSTHQWGRCSSSPGSASSSGEVRRGQRQPWPYVRKSSYSFPCYSYEHEVNNPYRDTDYREDYWDYRDSKSFKERNYSDICGSPYFIERRCSIRKHKRALDKNRYRDYRKLDTKRICIYRVYDSPEPQAVEREWWCDRQSSDSRRLKDRDRVWSSPKICQDRGYERFSPASRHSPASSSTTSISELSGDSDFHIKPAYSSRSQCHRINLTWPVETSARTEVSHCSLKDRSHSSPHTSATRPETVQRNTQPIISEPSKRQENLPENIHSTQVIKESTSPNKRHQGNRPRTLSLPLIGKLPSIKKGIKQTGVHKENGHLKPERIVASENGPQACPLTTHEKSPETCVTLNKRDATMTSENIIKTPRKISESPENQPLRYSTPPLTEQPIKFTEEELEKYRLLQLQAQQHMQQQHLQEQQEMPRQPTPVDVPQINHMTIPHEPSNQPMCAPCLQYTIFQPGTISAFPTSISTPSLPFASHHSHTPPPVLSQPHISYVPFPNAFFPTPPATVLAAHSLRLIPTPSHHPARLHPHSTALALHPLPQASLLPAMLTPAPMVATNMAAGGTLQIHPLLHPLFHSQELQHHPGAAS